MTGGNTMYSQVDFDRNKAQRGKMLVLMLLCGLPGLAAGVAGFVLRIEPL